MVTNLIWHHAALQGCRSDFHPAHHRMVTDDVEEIQIITESGGGIARLQDIDFGASAIISSTVAHGSGSAAEA